MLKKYTYNSQYIAHYANNINKNWYYEAWGDSVTLSSSAAISVCVRIWKWVPADQPFTNP